MLAVFLLMGRTKERLSSEVVTAFPAGRVVQMADARGASAKSAYTPPQYSPKPSTSHRVTGMVLYFGILLIVWWLIAAASGPNAYAYFEWCMSTLIGRLVLFGYTWALLHHMLGGVRHLIWDTLHGFEPAEREILALATIVGSVSLTLFVWVIGYFAMGGLR